MMAASRQARQCSWPRPRHSAPSAALATSGQAEAARATSHVAQLRSPPASARPLSSAHQAWPLHASSPSTWKG
eukprot:scaffold125926_cov48-Phaeocystis_antarctica.AAC.1